METFRWVGWRDEVRKSGGKRDGQSLCWTLPVVMCVIKGMKTTYLKVTNPGVKLSYLTEIMPDKML